jgi:hypothetical protein
VTLVQPFPQPPVDAVMPETVQTVATIVTGVLAGVLLVIVLFVWARRRDSIFLCFVLSSAVCAWIEPIVDILGLVWHPRFGQWQAFETFGRPIPVWVVFGYILVFGLLPSLDLVLLRRRVGYRLMWIATLVNLAVDTAIEVPLTAHRLYYYYGDQPLKIGEFPILQLAVNGTCALLIATVVFRFPQAFSGARALWLLLVAPAAQLGALAVGLPAFSVLNTDLPQGIRWIGVATSLGLGLLAMDRIIRFATGKTEFAAPDAKSGKRPAAEPVLP